MEKQPAENRVDALKRKLEERLQHSGETRVGEELHNLFGQFHARRIFKTVAIVSLEAALTLTVLYLALASIRLSGALDTCVQQVFFGGRGEACMAQSATLYCFGLAASLLFLCSFASTRYTHERRFQHSALFSVIVVFVLFFFSGVGAWSWGGTALVLLGALLVMFAGYRAALSLRGR